MIIPSYPLLIAQSRTVFAKGYVCGAFFHWNEGVGGMQSKTKRCGPCCQDILGQREGRPGTADPNLYR